MRTCMYSRSFADSLNARARTLASADAGWAGRQNLARFGLGGPRGAGRGRVGGGCRWVPWGREKRWDRRRICSVPLRRESLAMPWPWLPSPARARCPVLGPSLWSVLHSDRLSLVPIIYSYIMNPLLPFSSLAPPPLPLLLPSTPSAPSPARRPPHLHLRSRSPHPTSPSPLFPHVLCSGKSHPHASKT